MVHGAPDNYNVQKKAVTYRLDDMAELAVRVGSPDIFHRLGEVVLIESFENGIEGWDSDYVGDDSSFSLVGEEYKSGGFSAKLTAGSVVEDYIDINRVLQILNECKIGMELSICYDTVVAVTEIYIYYYNGINIYEARVKIDTENSTLSVKNGEGDFVIISSSLNLYRGLSTFHTIKLIVDISTKKYVKIIVNNDVFNLSDYDLYIVSEEIWELLVFGISLAAVDTGIATAWIDDIILTQNEP